MHGCENCGLFVAPAKSCYWLKKKLTQEEMTASNDCNYFIEIAYEDGVPLTPHQHMLFKQQDLDYKKMQIPK
jgi:hypothetical protein